MNRYREMRDRHWEVRGALPVSRAYCKSQFNEMMRKWGLDPEADKDKIQYLGDGCYLQTKDMGLYQAAMDELNTELQDAIAADETGEGFICEIFLDELANSYYEWMGDLANVLNLFGLSIEDIVEDQRFIKGFCTAVESIITSGLAS